MAVLEETAAARERLVDAPLDQDRADRLVAAADALGEGHQVGHDSFLLAGMQRSRAAHAAHHLVEDQQDTVAIADFADARKVAGRRRHGAGRGADNCLGDEAGDILRAEPEDLRLELVGHPPRIRLLGFCGILEAIGEAGGDLRDVDQQRPVRLTPPRVAARGEGAERVAVVALPSRDEEAARRLAFLEEILAAHLQRRFHRLRAAGHKIDPVHAGRRVADQKIGELFGNRGREERRVRIGEAGRLVLKGRDDGRMPVTEARHGSTAGGIDVAAALVVEEMDAGAADRDRRRDPRVAGEDVVHGALRATGSTYVPIAASLCCVRSMALSTSLPRAASTASNVSTVAPAAVSEWKKDGVSVAQTR
jgi:hypothetical protein